ncbi:MAG: MFS transporter [Bacteroidota bacterium]
MNTPSSLPFLHRLGLHRPELRRWAMYDWANSAFVLVVITAVFPIYFKNVAAAGLDDESATAWYGWTTSAALILTGLVSPFLGALADYLAIRKRLLGTFVLLGVTVTALMVFIHEGDWQLALILFGLGNIAVTGSFVFYDSLLPHLADKEEMDRVSAGGYAIGYLGSGLLLLIIVVALLSPGLIGANDKGTVTRMAFLGVALWWGVFSLPLLFGVREPRGTASATSARNGIVGPVFRRMMETLKQLRGRYRNAFTMLLAMMFYNEGIGTIIRMAAIYAASVGIPEADVIMAILLVQFIGVPCSFMFGNLAARWGTKPAILAGVVVYAVTCIVAFRMDSSAEFYLLAVLVALVQGGTQALSRSLFASMIPKHLSSEFFGFYSIFEKLSGIIGPAIFGMMVWLTGSSRDAILSVIGFFIVGAILLTTTNVAAGRQAAAEAELERA